MRRLKEVAVRTPAAARRSPAPSAKGRARAETILVAAKAVLVEKDFTHFSLRNIAAAANIHLANLQYYFPTREVLIQALLDHVVQNYDESIHARLAPLPDMPYPRFLAMIDYFLDDMGNPTTRRFFIQLYALFESCDAYGDATLLNQFSAPYINRLASYIAQLNPVLTPGERRQRAAMIGAMIDGMMVMLREADTELAPGQPEICSAMRKQILRMVMDP